MALNNLNIAKACFCTVGFLQLSAKASNVSKAWVG